MFKPKMITSKIFSIAFIIALFFSSLALFSHVGIMGDKEMMAMNTCPFSTGVSTLCSMTPLEHIETWQGMFAAIPVNDMFTIFLLLVVTVVIAPMFSRFSTDFLGVQLQKYQLAYVRSFVIPRPLHKAFSRGILNPKIF